jgi:hypothetical protein
LEKGSSSAMVEVAADPQDDVSCSNTVVTWATNVAIVVMSISGCRAQLQKTTAAKIFPINDDEQGDVDEDKGGEEYVDEMKDEVHNHLTCLYQLDWWIGGNILSWCLVLIDGSFFAVVRAIAPSTTRLL